MERFRGITVNILFMFITVMILVCMGMNGFGIATYEWWISAICMLATYLLNRLVGN